MSGTTVPVKIEGSEFDLEQITVWATAHPWFCGILFLISLTFWILRPSGFGGAVLEHRAKMREMNIKAEIDRRALTIRYGPDGTRQAEKLQPPPRQLQIGAPDRRKRDRRKS